MTLKLYHQVGHNPNWNKESFVDDACGDGLILSPVHQDRSQIDKLSVKIRRASIFDPQYYLPNSQKTKLQSYQFFPETLCGGFSNKKFAPVALDSARQCLQFQISSQFEKLIIPARYFSQMDPEFAEKQEEFSVTPFLKAASSLSIKKPLFLTLPLTSHMLESKAYRTTILNWITSFPEFSGLYVFAANERETKQPQNEEFLFAYLEFLKDLREVELDLQAGHLNTEALLLSLVGDISLSMGTFENTRMFSIEKFIVSSEERRGPKARIYLPGLLNWVQFDQAKQIQKSLPKVWSKIYEENIYGNNALASPVEPTFNQPALYKHHFLSFQTQVNALEALDVPGRYHLLTEWIGMATKCYKEIGTHGIAIERHGDGSHLQVWKKVIDAFATAYI